MRYTELEIKNRLAKLAVKPKENERLINKWKRILRKLYG